MGFLVFRVRRGRGREFGFWGGISDKVFLGRGYCGVSLRMVIEKFN